MQYAQAAAHARALVSRTMPSRLTSLVCGEVTLFVVGAAGAGAGELGLLGVVGVVGLLGVVGFEGFVGLLGFDGLDGFVGAVARGAVIMTTGDRLDSVTFTTPSPAVEGTTSQALPL